MQSSGFDSEKRLPLANLWFDVFIWSRSLFLGVYPLSNPPKDGRWEVVTASIQINFLYRNNSLVQLIKQCLLWNHVLIEIIVHRTSPTPQRSRSSESKWFIDFLFFLFFCFNFFPSRKWSRQISDKWKHFLQQPQCFVRLFSNLWMTGLFFSFFLFISKGRIWRICIAINKSHLVTRKCIFVI